jgi:N6-adenosine-specific RNA methylase IME4
VVLLLLLLPGRALELGRELLANWGYQRVDELIWVKTNSLQRLIRTGGWGVMTCTLLGIVWILAQGQEVLMGQR